MAGKEEEFSFGEIEDFDTIVLTYVNDIRKLIYTYVRHTETVEDLAQEVFLAAYKGYRNFRGESSVKTWLFKIAINKSKDHLKSWHHRHLVLTEFFQEKSNRDTAETEAMAGLEKQELAKAIMALPLKYREIIILYYYHDLSLPEICRLLNMNTNTVKTRLTRGRDLLKRRYRR
ncbi:sigma-70 family RNA polymerase sigma factor [Bacillus sp. FJAT-27245]|uniref:sigma-70 family RNA polymerase sigma factor n=1 Tax=Bacillus sp. FJAT-27245 TaxID=1684144 RepID=UPI0006A7E34E|nr:sigma-70 family RNA polymerase sigma factor [Bacillus sp. FJAT-27245]